MKGECMRIALCDDEEVFIDEVRVILDSLLEDPSKCDVVSCFSGEELLEYHQRESFDIIFLDIEMPGMNGMDTARKIRETDSGVIIVFLTSYQEFATIGYEVDAYRYLVKDQPAYVYEKQFKAILEEFSQKHKKFEIMDRNTKAIFYLKDIFFFDITNKTVFVHTNGASYKYFGSLSDVEEQLKNDSLFVRCHKSYIVNVTQIEAINNSGILMKNNQTLPLSRNNRKNVVDRYIAYMTGR